MIHDMAKAKLIEKSIKTKKEFSYTRPNGDVSLSFWLYVDDSHQLKEYLTMLKMAQKDLEDLIEGMSN